ncbi:MAG: hypothetical protein V9G19_16000 [Tetrasphaera sp.]
MPTAFFADALTYAHSGLFTIAWLAGFAEAMEAARSSLVLMSVPRRTSPGSRRSGTPASTGIAAACTAHPIMDAAIARGLPVVAGDPGPGSFVSIDERGAGQSPPKSAGSVTSASGCCSARRSTPRRPGRCRAEEFVAELSRVGPDLPHPGIPGVIPVQQHPPTGHQNNAVALLHAQPTRLRHPRQRPLIHPHTLPHILSDSR